MSPTGLEVFDRSLQATNRWVSLMMLELETDDRRLAFNALRGALHAVRDRIDPDEAAHLGAQMPMLLRGAYFEGWQPSTTPTRACRRNDFLDHVADEVPCTGEICPGEVARAGFAVMAQCLDPGETQRLRHILPQGTLDLWPKELLH
jgi:uncharacterized protein (DUF2267 family)